MKTQAVAFLEDFPGCFQTRFERCGLVFLRPDERIRIHGPRDEDIAFWNFRQMIDVSGFGFNLQDHFFAEGMADKAFIQARQPVKCEAIGEFSRAHPEKAPGLALDQGVYLPGNILDIHVDRDERDIQIILKDAIGAVERAVRLRVQDPVPAAKIIRSRGGAGFKEGALKVREPKFSLSGAEGRFFDAPEEGVLVGHDRDGDPPKGPQDVFGERRPRGTFIQIDMVDLGNLF